MYYEFSELQKKFRISSLCQIFEVTLRPCWEEGFPRHHVHRLPTQVIIESKGRLSADLEPQMAVVLHLIRHTDLLPLIKDPFGKVHPMPSESLYLAMPVGSPLLIHRTRLLQEASSTFIELAQDEERVVLVAVSHRRLINKSLVIRHCPVALFSLEGDLLWLHPAGPNYGLVKAAFPRGQRSRVLGPKLPLKRDPDYFNEVDDATGLPTMYAYAKECLKAAQEADEKDEPVFAAVLDFQAQSLIRRSIAEDAETAITIATQQFLRGFESFFGMGGLFPEPGHLD
jgi:hypothetical protein